MEVILVFLIESVLALLLYAGGVHGFWDLGPWWTALIAPIASGIIFILLLDMDVYFTKHKEDPLQILAGAMLLGACVGIYGAPIVFVLTGTWLPALTALGGGIGTLVMMIVGTVMVAEISGRWRERAEKNSE